jgi:trigger factor
LDNEKAENKAAEGTENQAASGHDSAIATEPEIDPCRQEITVEIPADVVAEEQERLIAAYSKEARVPGFRKGKVPASVVRNRFNDQLREELLEKLVPQYFSVAVMSSGQKPIATPSITNLQAEPGQAIRFTAAFDVMPEFELGDYKSVKVPKPVVEVTDDEVQAEITSLQERQASYDPVDEERPLKDGDFAQVAFEATPKSAPGSDVPATAEEPVKMDDVMVEIGSPNTVAAFTENLRGAKAGDEKNFEVSYPADFYDHRLAGKHFDYKVKINSIKKKTLPEVNDGFAKELSPEMETLDQLKAAIRENLQTHRQQHADHEAKEKLIEHIVDMHKFPVPKSMVDHQINLRLERGLRALAAQGMRTEDMKRMDFSKLRTAQAPAAIKEVKSGMLLHKIADAENIQVSDEELEREVHLLAYQTQQSPEEVKAQLVKDQGLERIRARMRGEKALDFLYTQS